jgi:hypothetical protein
MKAIFINAEKKSVEEIEIGDDWQLIAPQIGNGCRHFACATILENDDTIYVDDESLLHGEFKGYFKIGNSQPFAGNGLIMGSDDEGKSVDVKSSIEEIRNAVSFPYVMIHAY